jgi:hypothetical protein
MRSRTPPNPGGDHIVISVTFEQVRFGAGGPSSPRAYWFYRLCREHTESWSHVDGGATRSVPSLLARSSKWPFQRHSGWRTSFVSEEGPLHGGGGGGNEEDTSEIHDRI